MKNTYTIIAAIVVIILIILGVHHYSQSAASAPADASSSNSARVSTVGWKTYKTEGDFVEFSYPATWGLAGTKLASPSGAITINASYSSGSIPKCAPADCQSIMINGLTFQRTQDNAAAETDISYYLSEKHYIFNVVAKVVNNPDVNSNIALVDQIMQTVVVKAQ